MILAFSFLIYIAQWQPIEFTIKSVKAITPPNSEYEMKRCQKLHYYIDEIKEHDGEIVRLNRDDGTVINCGKDINSIPKIEIEL